MDIAQAHADRVLGVGHAEWFNPLLVAARAACGVPQRIEVERLNPRSDRGLDVDVVQDVMLHDLDWVSRWVDRRVLDLEVEVRAQGAAGIDEAVASLCFEGEVTARLRASRVESERRRLVHVAGTRADVTVDLVTGSVEGELSSPLAPPRESLDLLWEDFLGACVSRRAPVNDGRVGVAAMELVDRVRAVAAKDARG